MLRFGNLALVAVLVSASFDVAAQGRELDPVARQLGAREAREAQRAARQAGGTARRTQVMNERQEREVTCAKLTEWLSDIDSVPPEVQQRRFGGGTGASTAAMQIPYESWLLQDDRFVSFYGKPFDAVGADEMQRLQRGGNCPSPRNARGQAVIDNMFLYRSFDPRYHPRYADGVKAIRAAHAEVRTALAQLRALKPDDEGLRRYRELAAPSERLSAFLGEEPRSGYRQALQVAYQQVAQPVLASRSREAIAQAKGYDGLLALSQLQGEIGRDAASSRTAAGSAGEQLRAKQAAIARELVAQERARVDALGQGLVGLERGVQWHQDYRARYEKLTGSAPELREMLAHFEQRRGVLLEAAQPELSSRITQARSDRELDELTARYLPLDSDKRSVAGTALLTRVAESRDELHKRGVLGGREVAAADARAPAAAAQPAAAPPKTAPVAERVAAGEPTESDMYDLIKQRLDNAAAEVRNMAAECKGGFNQNDPAKAMLCLAGGIGTHAGAGEAMKITRFEKLGCERASGKPGYLCDYLVATSGGAARGMGASMERLIGRGGAGQARFLKTRDGWIGFFGEDAR